MANHEELVKAGEEAKAAASNALQAVHDLIDGLLAKATAKPAEAAPPTPNETATATTPAA